MKNENKKSEVTSTLYFIVAPEVNRVKIGVTQRPLARRLSELTGYSPVSVYVLAYVTLLKNEAFKMEKLTHLILQSKHDHGEWFEYDNEIREYVADLIWGSKIYGRFGLTKLKRKYEKIVKNRWGRTIYEYPDGMRHNP